ncbi:MAG: fibronectin type III domain-containing protein [bacterium]|nr:fibronectin type III domain-containing protein [bacterium]
MNKNTTIVLIIIILLAIFGIYYWANSTPSVNVPVDEPDIQTEAEVAQPEKPVVSTQNVSLISKSTAVLSGEVNPKGVQTSYWYEYGESDTLGSSTYRQLVGSGFFAYDAPATIVGLKADTSYYYRLGAENQYGKVYGAILSFKTDLDTPPVQYLLPSIETRSASNTAETSATIEGTVNPRGSETRYWFEYGQNFGLGNTTASASAGSDLASVAVSANLSGLQANKVYYYRLNAQNAYGTVNGNISVFITESGEPSALPDKEPAVSTGLPTGIGSTVAKLQGQVNPNGVSTIYHFEYGEATAFGLFSLDQSTDTKEAGKGSGALSVSGSIGGLKPDTVYYYRLVAQNEFGEVNGSILSFSTKE